MNRRQRTSDEPGRSLDPEAELKMIYGRRENAPAHSRREAPQAKSVRPSSRRRRA